MRTRVELLGLLGLPPHATTAEVRAAHRRLAKQLHPDRPAGNTAAFRRIQEAYEQLTQTSAEAEEERAYAPGWDEEDLPGPVHDDWSYKDH